MSARGIFVTGTDTGVGKTVVAASLLSVLRASGIDAVPMKPVQTGASKRDGVWAAPDLDFCLAVSGLSVNPDEYRLMAPACYALPASPHLAAAEAGDRVSVLEIADAFLELASRHSLVIAEGAGGVLVPLDPSSTMLDLMKELELPVVLVTRPNLGTINHTLLSIRELKRAGVPLLGIIFCDVEPTTHGLIERDNKKVIPRRSGVPVIGHVPYAGDLMEGPVTPEEFSRFCAPHLPKADELVTRITSP